MKARAPGTFPDRDAGDGSIAVGVRLLEHVDGACPGRVNPLARRVKPQVVDAEDRGKFSDEPPGLRIDNRKPSGLQGRREQATTDLIESKRMAVRVPRDFPFGDPGRLAVDDAEGLLIG